MVKRQKSSRVGHLDVMVSINDGGIVLELKRVATTACFSQLDRYSRICSGMVVVCWRATDPFKRVFKLTRTQIPVALFELKKKAPMIS